MEKAKQFAIDNGYIDVSYIGKWKDFEVYEPIMNDESVSFTGLPLSIMDDGKTIRMSTPDETMEILDYFNTDY